MNDPESIYASMWRDAAPRLARGENDVDATLDRPDDPRLGLSLIVRPDAAVSSAFDGFVESARALEPRQHYHAPSERHVTVLSVIGCHAGFELASVDVGAYVALIERCLAGIEPFEIAFDGVTASRDCVLAQGFPSGDGLGRLRASVRAGFADATLASSLDRRYPARTAHCTLVRFRRRLAAPAAFVDTLDAWRDRPFGRCRVDTVFLVVNDWFHRPGATRDLHRFALAPSG